MSKKTLLCLLMLATCGCNVTAPVMPDAPHEPATPILRTIALADLTEALADEIPISICDSDQLTLVLEDLIRANKLTPTQVQQIKSALTNIDTVRPLTKTDAIAIRGVK